MTARPRVRPAFRASLLTIVVCAAAALSGCLDGDDTGPVTEPAALGCEPAEEATTGSNATAWLVGAVMRLDQRAIAGAEVRAIPQDPARDEVNTTSDAAGCYRLVLEAEQVYAVDWWREGYQEERLDAIRLDAAAVEVQHVFLRAA